MSRNATFDQQQENEVLSPPPRPLSLVQEPPQEQNIRQRTAAEVVTALQGVIACHNDAMNRMLSMHTSNTLRKESSKDAAVKVIELQAKIAVLLRKMEGLERPDDPAIPPQQGYYRCYYPSHPY